MPPRVQKLDDLRARPHILREGIVKRHDVRNKLAGKLGQHPPVLSAVRGVKELITLSRIPTKSTGPQVIFVMELTQPEVVEREVLADMSAVIA
jgi:hypothetical protein